MAVPLTLSLAPPPAWAASLPSGFAESLVTAGLASPTAMALAPDGRIFVCEQGGRLRVIKDGALLPAPFATLSVHFSGERGLLGVALDPDFSVNQYVYVYYTVPGSPAHNRVSRFTANGDVAVSGSEVVILELNNLSAATNHNGGALHFGIDDKLYIGVGENANSSNAQILSNLLGKMLRINPDGSIPTDNPFYSTASGMNRAIWALGLRNPFSFAVQPGTGRRLGRVDPYLLPRRATAHDHASAGDESGRSADHARWSAAVDAGVRGGRRGRHPHARRRLTPDSRGRDVRVLLVVGRGRLGSRHRDSVCQHELQGDVWRFAAGTHQPSSPVGSPGLRPRRRRSPGATRVPRPAG